MSWLTDANDGWQRGSAPDASPFPAFTPPPTQAEILDEIRKKELENQSMAGGDQSMLSPGDVKARMPFGFAPGPMDMGKAASQFAMNDVPAGTGIAGPLGAGTPTDAERQMMAMVGRPAEGIRPGAPDGSPFGAPAAMSQFQPMGIPPSIQLASQMVAPSPPGPAAAPPLGAVPPPVPVPQPRPDGAPDAGDTETPPNATPTQGRVPGGPAAAPVVQAPVPAQVPLAQRIANIGPGLMGIGAAMQGDMGHLALANAKQDQALSEQAQTQNLTARALIAKGVDPAVVAAAVRQPELLKALIADNFGKSKYKLETISKDEFGGEQKAFVNQNDPTDQLSVDGKKINVSGDSTVPTGTSNSAYLAKGVPAVNHDLVGDSYLQQYSPEVQSAVKDYLGGRTAPTSNPRKGWAENIKKISQKYGTDMGIPADDASFVQRKAFATSLGDTKSGVGLQAKGFQQGLEHFVKLSDNLVKMNLSNGLGLEDVAKGVNWVKNLTTDQQELVHKSDVIGQALAREMGNLFSKGGGGVHEAADTKKAVSNSLMSRKSAAGSLEAIDELVQGGLRSLEERRDALFPHGDAPKASNFLGPKQQEALDRIRSNIAILKGESAAPTAAAAPLTAGKTSTGINWSVH